MKSERLDLRVDQNVVIKEGMRPAMAKSLRRENGPYCLAQGVRGRLNMVRKGQARVDNSTS